MPVEPLVPKIGYNEPGWVFPKLRTRTPALLYLPPNLRNLIYADFLGAFRLGSNNDIEHKRSHRGRQELRFQTFSISRRGFRIIEPDAVKLMLVCRAMKAEVMELVTTRCILREQLSIHRSEIFGNYLTGTLARSLKQLELFMGWRWANQEHKWATALHYIVHYMPNLIYFNLYSHKQPSLTYSGYNWWSPYRLDRAQTLQLHFMAYTILRHPKLNRLVLPVPKNFNTIDDSRSHRYDFLIAEKSYNEQENDSRWNWEELQVHVGNRDITIQDEVLSSTKIRRLTQRDLGRTSLSRLRILPKKSEASNVENVSAISNDDVVTSEVPEELAYPYFEGVDQLGLRNDEFLQQIGMPIRGVNEMIAEAAWILRMASHGSMMP